MSIREVVLFYFLLLFKGCVMGLRGKCTLYERRSCVPWSSKMASAHRDRLKYNSRRPRRNLLSVSLPKTMGTLKSP